MGHLTVTMVYNDQIDSAPDELRYAARHWQPRKPGVYNPEAHFGWGQVVSQAHADYPQITVCWCNEGRRLEDCDNLNYMALDQLKQALERHGYRVTKRRKKPE